MFYAQLFELRLSQNGVTVRIGGDAGGCANGHNMLSGSSTIFCHAKR